MVSLCLTLDALLDCITTLHLIFGCALECRIEPERKFAGRQQLHSFVQVDLAREASVLMRVWCSWGFVVLPGAAGFNPSFEAVGFSSVCCQERSRCHH